MRWTGTIILTALSLATCEAQVPTFTGSWKLSVAKSRWGKKQPPINLVIEIDNNEPFFRYSGTVVDALGEGRQFSFTGAIDGKEHDAVRPSGEGKVILERIGPYTITGTFKSNDGTVVERTIMTLSQDGKTLTYSVRITEQGREIRWTEIYERR